LFREKNGRFEDQKLIVGGLVNKEMETDDGITSCQNDLVYNDKIQKFG
jgi:hypothetical protein